MMETSQSPPEPVSDHPDSGLIGHLLHNKSSTMRSKSKTQFWTIANSLALFYVLASIVFPIVLFAPISGNLKGLYDKCDADGDFDFNADHYDSDRFSANMTKSTKFYYESFHTLFSRPSIVAVTVPFGNYSFAQARWIDLAWDIGVGRIGQMLLVYVSYIAITRSMLHAMETTAVPHRLFADISFLGPSSMLTLWSVITVTPKCQLWKAWKGRLLTIALIMAYLIAFPTLVSAMTGYGTTFSTRIEIGESSVNWYSDEILVVQFTLGNCSIFGESNGCHVAGNSEERVEIVETQQAYNYTLHKALETAYYCQENYTFKECGRLDTGDTNLSIDPVDSLNMSRGFNELYAYNKKVYHWTYMSQHGQCEPGKEYHWGFSYQLLFLFSVFNLLWAVSLWSLWIMASGEYGFRTDYGMYRAAVDFVAVIQGTLGDNMEKMSSAEMEKELDGRKIGIVRSDEDARDLLHWDWTLFYRKRYRPPFKAQVEAIRNSIMYGMLYIGRLSANAVSWLGWLWSIRRGRRTERNNVPLFPLQTRGYSVSSSSRL